MGDSERTTIIDVLEQSLGTLTADRVQQLTPQELDALADAVNEFYVSWTAPPLTDEELRVYSGGWIAGNFEGVEPRQYLFTSLIYAPTVIIHDHIAEWFYPDREALQSPAAIPARRGQMMIQGAEPQLLRGNGFYVFRGEPERSREYLAQVIPTMALLAPLIRSGAVIPVPHLSIMRSQQNGILTAVRHDVQSAEFVQLVANPADVAPPRTDQIRGMDIMPEDGVAAGDEMRAVGQNPSYFLNKTLAIADATGSLYVPPAATDAALLDYRVRLLARDLASKNVDLQVAAGLTTADLPFLGSLDPATLVAIRQDEVAFADWRRELRTIGRLIQSTPAEGAAFARESNEVLTDALMPRVHEIEKAVARSAVMKEAAREGGVGLGIGAASAVGAALATGDPIASSLAGLGLSTVARWVYATVFRSSPSGTRGVLATLIKKP
jgi:hypothetical protein